MTAAEGNLLLEAPIGHAGLLALSAALLAASAAAAMWLQRWGERNPVPNETGGTRRQALGGSPFAGATAVLRSPYLTGIALFVILLAAAGCCGHGRRRSGRHRLLLL